jgi:NTE family protein
MSHISQNLESRRHLVCHLLTNGVYMASANKTLGLGLQGGGSHAAFTWGVLDRLLDEVEIGNLSIAAISGTSGGALNGAVCAYGLMDGPKVAKQLLKKLWDASSGKALWPVEPYRMLLPADSTERWNVDYSPTAIFLGMAEQICSPYWNPLLWDAVGEVIEQVITDFDRMNEVSSNASWVWEMRQIELINQLLKDHQLVENDDRDRV